MTKTELKQWYDLYKQFRNGYHLSAEDWKELVRLNHLIMHECHQVHNFGMLERNK